MTKICFPWIVLGRSWPIVVVVYRYFFILYRIFYFVNSPFVWWYDFVFYLISLFTFLCFLPFYCILRKQNHLSFCEWFTAIIVYRNPFYYCCCFCLFSLFDWLIDSEIGFLHVFKNSVIIPIRAYFLIILKPRINRVGVMTGEEGKIPGGK